MLPKICILLFQEGAFEVPIKAVLPKYDIEVPQNLHFNMCAAKDFIEASFDVRNSGYGLKETFTA